MSERGTIIYNCIVLSEPAAWAAALRGALPRRLLLPAVLHADDRHGLVILPGPAGPPPCRPAPSASCSLGRRPASGSSPAGR